MSKRIYSLNLVSYLNSKGINEKEIQIDENKQNKVFFIFKETAEVAQAIKEYKNNNELKKFLNCYKQIKEKINKFKGID